MVAWNATKGKSEPVTAVGRARAASPRPSSALLRMRLVRVCRRRGGGRRDVRLRTRAVRVRLDVAALQVCLDGVLADLHLHERLGLRAGLVAERHLAGV